MLCAGRHNIALAAYNRCVQNLDAMHRLRRRGLYHVAFFDLVEALEDPDVGKANSAISEVSESFWLLRAIRATTGRKLRAKSDG